MLTKKGERNVNWQSNKGSLVPIVILGVAAIVIIIFTYVYFIKDKEAALENKGPKTFGDLVQVVDPAELPGSMPTDMPIEKDVPLFRNEMVYFSNRGEIHAVRSYYTARPQEEVFAEFAEYFNSNKWEPLSAIDDENVKFLLARKEGVDGVVQVNISKNQIDGRVLVEITQVQKNSNSSSQ